MTRHPEFNRMLGGLSFLIEPISGWPATSCRKEGMPALPIASDRIDALTALELLLDGTPKTQHVSAVIGDLEGPESVARIG
jgi:hypothetical protein